MTVTSYQIMIRHHTEFLCTGFLLLILIVLSSEACYSSDIFQKDPQSVVSRHSAEQQILYNGKIWRNLYSATKGDQFLFSNDFLAGNVSIGDRVFEDASLRYDIYDDELQIMTPQGVILSLNKENIDAFTLWYNNRQYDFIKKDEYNISKRNGYLNILYNGRLKLYVKFRKEILLLAVDNKYDLFTLIQHIYLEKGSKMYLLRKKRDVINLFPEYKDEIKDFLRHNKISLSRKDPDSFMALIEYCDNLRAEP